MADEVSSERITLFISVCRDISDFSHHLSLRKHKPAEATSGSRNVSIRVEAPTCGLRFCVEFHGQRRWISC